MTNAAAINANLRAAALVLRASQHVAIADDGDARRIFSRALDALDNERRRLRGRRIFVGRTGKRWTVTPATFASRDEKIAAERRAAERERAEYRAEVNAWARGAR